MTIHWAQVRSVIGPGSRWLAAASGVTQSVVPSGPDRPSRKDAARGTAMVASSAFRAPADQQTGGAAHPDRDELDDEAAQRGRHAPAQGSTVPERPPEPTATAAAEATAPRTPASRP